MKDRVSREFNKFNSYIMIFSAAVIFYTYVSITLCVSRWTCISFILLSLSFFFSPLYYSWECTCSFGVSTQFIADNSVLYVINPLSWRVFYRWKKWMS